MKLNHNTYIKRRITWYKGTTIGPPGQIWSTGVTKATTLRRLEQTPFILEMVD